MRAQTEWKPSKEEIAWTKEALSSLDENGGVWAPHGLEYKRTGESALQLVSMVHHEGTVEAHSRICVVADSMGWTVSDDSVERVAHELPPEIIAGQQQAELERIQNVVSGWGCPTEGCEVLLVDMPLDMCEWVNHGEHEFTNPENGETGTSERWLAHIKCHECHQVIPMNPLDFGYLGGEDLFYTWRINEFISYRVLTREQTVALIDSGGHGIPLGSKIDGEVVPPHMQGTFCVLELANNEEE